MNGGTLMLKLWTPNEGGHGDNPISPPEGGGCGEEMGGGELMTAEGGCSTGVGGGVAVLSPPGVPPVGLRFGGMLLALGLLIHGGWIAVLGAGAASLKPASDLTGGLRAGEVLLSTLEAGETGGGGLLRVAGSASSCELTVSEGVFCDIEGLSGAAAVL